MDEDIEALVEELQGVIGKPNYGKRDVDELTFSHFFFNDKEWQDFTETIAELYHVRITIDDYLHGVAEKIKDQRLSEEEQRNREKSDGMA